MKPVVVCRDGGLVTFKWSDGKTTETNVEDCLLELAHVKPMLNEANASLASLRRENDRLFEENADLRKLTETQAVELSTLRAVARTTTKALEELQQKDSPSNATGG